MHETKRGFFITLITIFMISACSAQPTQAQPLPGQSAQPEIIEPFFTPSANLPLTEREVPRVSIEEARVALEAGTAVIVDVRSPAAFESRHIAGAINIPLAEIEMNLTGLTLDKEQWIITYCT